ncbi:hypothetical protein GGR28_002029 [Lewinella aquimaris]|uniref:Uncharacterized protein n=1 Tax=Neolewinella aquimaris TaxID=1835722 RepID=A0A840EC83_9BACT|nr:hypothetical protein [Neolewinella aquimaris]MBB4079409.1 hypothetical protein [Neolewinella aquimaris]
MKDCCKTDTPRSTGKKILNGITSLIIGGLILSAIILTLIRYL